jgi:hypothetical protein
MALVLSGREHQEPTGDSSDSCHSGPDFIAGRLPLVWVQFRG